MKSAAKALTTILAMLCLLHACTADPGVAAVFAARSGELQFLGQPSPDELARLREDGIDIVVNLRPESEMDWDEAGVATELGLEYHAVAIARSGHGFERAAIERITAIVDANPDRDVVLHCSSANRVSAWFAIYLVQQQGLSLEEALQRARATGLTRAALEQRIEDYLGES